MTAGATSLWARGAVHVLRVIELYVEGLIEAGREIFEWRVAGAYVCVTDRAHRHLRRCELAAMTIRARFVTRKAWCC
jgi:hypothetical protein